MNDEALIEKVAEAIRQSVVMKMEEGEDLALYVANIWRTYARAALATIEAEQQAEVAALVEAGQRYRAANTALTAMHEKQFVDGTATDAEWAGLVADAWSEHDRARDAIYRALEPFERTLGSTHE